MKTIHINPLLWSSVFAVPTGVVDEHIRMAGSAQLKVLLWFLRHIGDGPTPDGAAEALRMAKADVTDALQYWIENGVFSEEATEESAPCAESIPSFSSPSPEKNRIVTEKPTADTAAAPSLLLNSAPKPTREEVARRGMESSEIAFLLNEAQLRLGRLLSQNDMATLVWLYDYAGMPASVILMVIEFAVMEEKRSTRYIEKVALDWIDHDIDTVAKAEARISQIQKSKSAWNHIVRLLGLESRNPTQAEQSAVTNWISLWKLPDELILTAYEETVDHTGKYKCSYMNKILKKWFETGIKSKKELERSASEKAVSGTASFNVEDYERIAMRGPETPGHKKENS